MNERAVRRALMDRRWTLGYIAVVVTLLLIIQILEVLFP